MQPVEDGGWYWPGKKERGRKGNIQIGGEMELLGGSAE